MGIVIRPATREHWSDLAALFGARGACGGCWCMFWRQTGADFAARKGFTFTVLDPADRDVIGCVYLYPPEREGDVIVQSWVRADRAELDEPLADAVAAWLADEWPWENPDRCGR